MLQNYSIIIPDYSSKVKIIKIYRDFTGLGLKEAKDVIDQMPNPLFHNLSQQEALNIQEAFSNEGINVILDKKNISVGNNYDKKSYSNADDSYNGNVTNKELIIAFRESVDIIQNVEGMQAEVESKQRLLVVEKEKAISMRKRLGAIGVIVIIILSFLAIGVISFFGLIVGPILGYFIGKAINSAIFKSKYEIEAENYYNEHVPQIEIRIEELMINAKEVVESRQFEEAQQLIPQDYFNSSQASDILKLLENRRADTLKEAINMYEDNLHKTRLEDMQRQQVEAAQRSADAQQAAAVAAQQTASAAVDQAESARKIAKNTKSISRTQKLNTFINLTKK